MKHSTPLELLVEEFLKHVSLKQHRSSSTLVNYRRYLERFLLYTRAQTPRDITRVTVERYREWLAGGVHDTQNTTHLSNKHTFSKRTQNYHLTALRRFLVYLHEKGASALTPTVVKLHTAPYRRPAPISPDTIQTLLHHTTTQNLKSLRDRAILYVIVATGMRASELCSLSLSDITVSKRHVLIHAANTTHTLICADEAYGALTGYLTARHDNDEALFITVGRHPRASGDVRLTQRSIQRIVASYARKVAQKGHITPQSIRRHVSPVV